MKREPRRAPVRPKEVEASQIVFSGRSIKWLVGIIGSLLVAIIGWLTLWDRIDARWRHESVQAAQDRANAAEIAAAREKAASDTKALGARLDDETRRLAKRAEQGRAWVVYSITDFRADNQAQWAQVCGALKQPAEVCEKWKTDAQAARQEATEARRSATEAGKEK